MQIHNIARLSVALLLGLTAACSRRERRVDTSSAAGGIATDTSTVMAPPTTTPSGVVLMTVTRPGRGLILVDGTGRTLYVLDRAPRDTDDWRPVTGTAAPTSTDTAVKASLIGTTSGPKGTMQATYAGKPLYYYDDDTGPNDMKGDGEEESGATGHVIHPDGTVANGSKDTSAGAKRPPQMY